MGNHKAENVNVVAQFAVKDNRIACLEHCAVFDYLIYVMMKNFKKTLLSDRRDVGDDAMCSLEKNFYHVKKFFIFVKFALIVRNFDEGYHYLIVEHKTVKAFRGDFYIDEILNVHIENVDKVLIVADIAGDEFFFIGIKFIFCHR